MQQELIQNKETINKLKEENKNLKKEILILKHSQ